MVRLFAVKHESLCESVDIQGILPPTYQYWRWDDIDEKQQPLQHNQSVWICKSKGKKTRPELFLRARVLQVTQQHDESEEEDNDHHNNEDRILVQYPKGSTYRVRRNLVIPILNDNYHVLVYPETTLYRRGCVVHCGQEEIFVEIGCAEGITCQRVWETGNKEERLVLGIDKSELSVQRAREKYPHCRFVEGDILQGDDCHDWSSVIAKCTEHDDIYRHHHCKPDVVAIDINGNRELDAVLRCLRICIEEWQPRLILVKSRSLYYALPDKELREGNYPA